MANVAEISRPAAAPAPTTADQMPMEQKFDRHANTFAQFGSEWADRLVLEADRLVEEAEAKRRRAIELANEMRRRASETAADLRLGFDRLRHAGRALEEARREFNNGHARAR